MTNFFLNCLTHGEDYAAARSGVGVREVKQRSR